MTRRLSVLNDAHSTPHMTIVPPPLPSTLACVLHFLSLCLSSKHLVCFAECDAGYYCTAGSDSSTSAVCPAGNFCPANTPSATHYPCPAGTYSATTGLVDKSGCKNCTVGAYCPEGSTAPTSCLAGTYQPAGSATDVSACLSCEPGWACPSAGMWEMTTL